MSRPRIPHFATFSHALCEKLFEIAVGLARRSSRSPAAPSRQEGRTMILASDRSEGRRLSPRVGVGRARRPKGRGCGRPGFLEVLCPFCDPAPLHRARSGGRAGRAAAKPPPCKCRCTRIRFHGGGSSCSTGPRRRVRRCCGPLSDLRSLADDGLHPDLRVPVEVEPSDLPHPPTPPSADADGCAFMKGE